MQTIILPDEYQAARYTVKKITPALNALKQIDKQSLGYDEAAWAETEEFLGFLDQMRAKSQAIIDRGIEQYDRRPQALINAACHRFFEIPKEYLIKSPSRIK
jgi:hypothetical protein